MNNQEKPRSRIIDVTSERLGMSYGIVGTVSPEKEAERMAELNELAEAGNGSAALRLGEIYRLGAWVEKDLTLSYQWYKRAADLGNADGMNNLGSMYLNGMGCEKDPTLAVEWYRKSASKGCAQGGYNLAKRYLHGDYIEKDLDKAAEILDWVAATGYIEAMTDLAAMICNGDTQRKDMACAVVLLNQASERGDTKATQNLEYFLDKIENAAWSGDYICASLLSEMYREGRGVKKNLALSWAWISFLKFCQPNAGARIPPSHGELERSILSRMVDEDSKTEGNQICQQWVEKRGLTGRSV